MSVARYFHLPVGLSLVMIAIVWYVSKENILPLPLPQNVNNVSNSKVSRGSSPIRTQLHVPAVKSVFVNPARGKLKTGANSIKTTQDTSFERYERCEPFPAPSNGGTWPEDNYANDTPLHDLSFVASGARSKVTMDGGHVVPLGAAVRVKVAIFDREERPKNVGGDLVRVWMKEQSLGASSTGVVVDHGNGSYTATLTALWVGKPKIMAALIMSREQISAVSRRRLMCPSTIFEEANFQRGDFKTTTPCSIRPYIVGYKELCNMTDINFGRALFCGKPRHEGVDCSDWQTVSDRKLWLFGHESKVYSDMEYRFLNKFKGHELIPSAIVLNVAKGPAQPLRIESQNPCYDQDTSGTWNLTSPTGYMYTRKWNNFRCKQTVTSYTSVVQCVRNMSVLIIGDSTGRQIFDRLRKIVGTEDNTFIKLSKHGGNFYKNDTIDFTLVQVMHELPISTRNTDRHFFLPFFERVKHLQKGVKTIVLLHMFSHFKPYHSYVFHTKWIQTKHEIIDFLNRHPDVHLMIKGPHAYPVAMKDKRACSVAIFPDHLAEIHSKMLHDIFQGFHERVLYLNAYDITVATEQTFIHPDDYIVDEHVFTMLSFVCP